MSMDLRELGTIPEETARVARAACPKGTLAMRLRDAACGELYEDEQFTALYAVEGQPASARLSAGGRHRAAVRGESHRPSSC
jgi:transposase